VTNVVKHSKHSPPKVVASPLGDAVPGKSLKQLHTSDFKT